MNDYDLLAMLKNNLTVEVNAVGTKVIVQIFFADTLICQSSDSISLDYNPDEE